jgi:nitrite reductase/ring-hydroxylating ferredoxin subunit
MKKIKIAELSELAPGRSRQVKLLGKSYAVFNIDGSLYAVEGSCKHMKAALAAGRLEDSIVTCPMHGWQYDVKTGECLTESWAKLRTFDLKVEQNTVYILLP